MRDVRRCSPWAARVDRRFHRLREWAAGTVDPIPGVDRPPTLDALLGSARRLCAAPAPGSRWRRDDQLLAATEHVIRAGQSLALDLVLAVPDSATADLRNALLEDLDTLVGLARVRALRWA